MRSRSPRRYLQALAVTLPLGLDPSGEGAAAPRVKLPAEIVADAEALGAVGVVHHGGPRSQVCGAVALRDRAQAPMLGALQFRPSVGPSRALTLTPEKLPASEAPAGFVVWYACGPVGEPAPGAALSTLLISPSDPPTTPARRRVDVPAGEPGVWRWRALQPIEAGIALADAPGRPRRPQAWAGNPELPGTRVN